MGNRIVYSCHECSDYNLCPHSYREYDLESELNELKEENDKLNKQFLKIINHYGVRYQLKHFIGEVYEVIEAILDFNSGNNYEHGIEHIAEEIADCYVMLEEFRNYYNIPREDIEKVMKEKAERTLNRIAENLD